MHRILDFFRNPSNTRTVSILAVLVIALAIPLTVNIAQKQQELRQHAAEAPTCTLGEGLTCETGEKRDDCSNGLSRTCSCGEGYTGTEVFEKQSDGMCYSSGKCYATCTGKVKPPTTPSSQNPDCGTGAAAGGTCISAAECEASGVTTLPGNCGGGLAVCCQLKTPAPGGVTQTCSGGCYDSPLQAPFGWVQQAGGCSTGFCYVKPTATTSTCSQNGGHCLANIDAISCPTGETPQDSLTCPGPDQKLCCKATGASAPGVGGTSQTPTGTCPTVISNGNTGAGGNCNNGDPNVDIGRNGSLGNCLSDKCGSTKVPGHTISVCQFNPQAGRLCYANNPAECWPDNPCPTSNPVGISLTCINGADPTCTSPLISEKTVNGKWFCRDAQDNISLTTNPTCAGRTTLTITPTVAPTPGTSISCTVVPTCTGGSPNTSNGTTWTCSNGATPDCRSTIGSTIIAFNASLHGLGSVGDVKNIQQTKIFYTPKRSRSMVVQLFDSTNTIVKTATGNLGYNPSSGQFLGTTVNLGTISGTYTVKIKPDGYLQRTFTNVTVNNGQTTNLLVNPTFIAGDINNINNAVDSLDYNIFLSCSIFSTDNGAVCNSNPNFRTFSDFNDDGVVDQIDYNLLIREFGAPGE